MTASAAETTLQRRFSVHGVDEAPTPEGAGASPVFRPL